MTVEDRKAEELLQSTEEVAIDNEKHEVTGEGQEALEGSEVELGYAPGLVKQIEALTLALENQKDQALRAQAEVQNVKARVKLDVEKSHKFALEKFVESLLPVLDSLEKGIESAEQVAGEGGAMKEGMDLTLKLFLTTLARFNVLPINPEGEPFDPHFHQAMSMVVSPEVEPNTVITVFQKGYMLNERVVRPAMVVVSKVE